MNFKLINMKWTLLLCLLFPLSLALVYKNDLKENTAPSMRAVDKTGMDMSISPGENFFLYANGNWLERTEIPASETGWGSFYTLRDDVKKNLHKILEEITAKDNPPGSADQKIADLYLSGMDTTMIDQLGYQPITQLLEKIDAVKNSRELINLAAAGYPNGDGFLFGLDVYPDDKTSTKNIVHFVQTGLGLPNRDYYFKTDSVHRHIRRAYLDYIVQLFTSTGLDRAKAMKQAKAILKLETVLAASHSTPIELRDPIKNYHKLAVIDFQKQVPNINLKEVLDRMLIQTDTLLVAQPKYYQRLNRLLKTEAIAIWKAKLKFDTLNEAAGNLSKPFDNARFNFYGKILRGQQVQQERWKRMLNMVDVGMGELLGQLYVARYFKPEAKQRMLALVNNLQAVYESRITKLDWMSAETKEHALKKLQAFEKKIGYPDQWKKYDALLINRKSYYENIQSIAVYNYQEMLKKIGKPVDKTEWGMTASTINAYYNPSFNEIVFPAGILQFPFFDFAAHDAVNYGAIGAIIGHEMTHGFDDQGRQYDQDGNLKDWWTDLDASRFKVKAQAVVDQYNKYTVLNDLKVNGNLTLGENIADIGGLAIAYEAFKMTEQGKGNELIDGLSPDQRFFLSFAQLWRIKMRDETTRMRISTDPHAPAMYRVNGPLSNMKEFYTAFNIKLGDKMYRPESERVHLW